MITTYNQAKRLKELGYDKECDDIFWEDGDFEEGMGKYNYNQKEIAEYDNMISAPTISEALQWIRENKKDVLFRIDCFYSPMLKNVAYQGIRLNRNALIIKSRTNEYLTYPEAESALLDELLTYLEQKR